MSEKGLRLEKKEATKRAIAEAAFKLATEHGLDRIIIEDIVELAGYSRRTFANYFSCKEEAVASSLPIINFQGDIDDLSSTLSKDELTPIKIIELAIERNFTIDKLKRLHELVSLSRKYPSLELYVIGALKEIQDFAIEGISRNFGDTYSKEYYHLLMGAIFGSLLPILEESINVQLPNNEEDDEVNHTFKEYMKTIFSQLKKGFN